MPRLLTPDVVDRWRAVTISRVDEPRDPRGLIRNCLGEARRALHCRLRPHKPCQVA
jgi:hypothetical protein